MKKWLKYMIGIAAVLLVVGVIVAVRSRGEKQPRTVRAERGEIKQEVSFSGRLAPEQEAELAFELGGTVTQVLAQLGQSVEKGQPLMVVDDRIAALELAKARADTAAAQEQKQLAWNEAQHDASQTQAENARLLEKKRQAVRDAKRELDQQQKVHSRTAIESGEVAATESARLALQAKESLYHAAQQDLTQTLKTVEKSNQLKQDAAEQAEATYLATTQASGRVAGLSSLEASRALAAVRLAKTTLRAPFDGVVTLADTGAGEYATAGKTVVTVATTGALELKADVPETDAAKLFSGAVADVTFDVYGSRETWKAEVISIAPAAKVIEGVPTFEIRLQLLSSDPRFKPGLTANIMVHTAQREHVLALPRRAIIRREGKEYVKVQDGETEREIEVTTGLLGSDGRIEILSGLNGGEEIIVSSD